MNYKQIVQEIFQFNRRFIDENMTDEERYQWMQRFVMYTSDELMEVLEELPFKHWKKYKTEDISKQRMLEELSDVLIFTFGMVDILGYSADDIFKEIASKNAVNNKRQEDGY